MAYFHTPEAFMLGDPVCTAKGPEVNTSHVLLTLDDKLSKKDASFKKGNALFYLKQNPVQFGKGKAYLISLHSSHFDTYLYLKDQNDKTVAENDDYGSTTTRLRVLFYAGRGKIPGWHHFLWSPGDGRIFADRAGSPPRGPVDREGPARSLLPGRVCQGPSGAPDRLPDVYDSGWKARIRANSIRICASKTNSATPLP